MIVRRCTIEDIDSVYKVEKEAFAEPMKRETMQKDLERESYFCYGLFENELVSFMSFDKVFEEGQIISVATLPTYRKRGLAKELLKKVFCLAKENGVELFTLEVRCDNYPAIALYKDVGFNEVGLRKNYYQNPSCDAILMDLHLEKD